MLFLIKLVNMLYQFLLTLKTIVLFVIRKAEELLQDLQLRIV